MSVVICHLTAQSAQTIRSYTTQKSWTWRYLQILLKPSESMSCSLRLVSMYLLQQNRQSPAPQEPNNSHLHKGVHVQSFQYVYLCHFECQELGLVMFLQMIPTRLWRDLTNLHGRFTGFSCTLKHDATLCLTSTCAFLADTFTDTFTASTYLVITTIVVSVGCSFLHPHFRSHVQLNVCSLGDRVQHSSFCGFCMLVIC